MGALSLWNKSNWDNMYGKSYAVRILPLIDQVLENLILMPKGASSHMAPESVSKIARREILPISWPACSSDLNPVKII